MQIDLGAADQSDKSLPREAAPVRSLKNGRDGTRAEPADQVIGTQDDERWTVFISTMLGARTQPELTDIVFNACRVLCYT